MELVNYKGNKFSPTQLSENLTQILRENWGTKEITVEEVKPNKKGDPVIKEITKSVPHNNRTLNAGFDAKLIPYVMTLVPEECSQRIMSIIEADDFEANKVIQVFESVPKLISGIVKSPITLKESIQLNTPSLATYGKYVSKDSALKLIASILTSFSKKLAGRNKIETQYFQELSIDIFSNYHHLTVGDIYVGFNNAIVSTDRDTKIYSLDYATVIRIIDQISEIKYQEAERLSDRNHIQSVQLEKHFRENIEQPSAAFEIEKVKFLNRDK